MRNAERTFTSGEESLLWHDERDLSAKRLQIARGSSSDRDGKNYADYLVALLQSCVTQAVRQTPVIGVK
jgi:hypothetical protein